MKLFLKNKGEEKEGDATMPTSALRMPRIVIVPY